MRETNGEATAVLQVRSGGCVDPEVPCGWTEVDGLEGCWAVERVSLLIDRR